MWTVSRYVSSITIDKWSFCYNAQTASAVCGIKFVDFSITFQFRYSEGVCHDGRLCAIGERAGEVHLKGEVW